jgi:hypothetical protein
VDVLVVGCLAFLHLLRALKTARSSFAERTSGLDNAVAVALSAVRGPRPDAQVVELAFGRAANVRHWDSEVSTSLMSANRMN